MLNSFIISPSFSTKYLNFFFANLSESGKTKIWDVISRNHGDILGTIQWFGRWRQYAFFPTDKTIYNRECLEDISKFLTLAQKEHRKLLQRKDISI